MEGRVWGETSSSVFHKEIDGKYSVGVTYTKDKPVYVFRYQIPSAQVRKTPRFCDWEF